MRSPTGAPKTVPATIPNVAAATAADAVPGMPSKLFVIRTEGTSRTKTADHGYGTGHDADDWFNAQRFSNHNACSILYYNPHCAS